jgi:hypothetical protein
MLVVSSTPISRKQWEINHLYGPLDLVGRTRWGCLLSRSSVSCHWNSGCPIGKKATQPSSFKTVVCRHEILHSRLPECGCKESILYCAGENITTLRRYLLHVNAKSSCQRAPSKHGFRVHERHLSHFYRTYLDFNSARQTVSRSRTRMSHISPTTMASIADHCIPNEACPFLDLPGELRNEVYGYLSTPENFSCIPINRNNRELLVPRLISLRTHQEIFMPPLWALLTSHQIHDEVVVMVYQDAHFGLFLRDPREMLHLERKISKFVWNFQRRTELIRDFGVRSTVSSEVMQKMVDLVQHNRAENITLAAMELVESVQSGLLNRIEDSRAPNFTRFFHIPRLHLVRHLDIETLDLGSMPRF